MPAAATSERAAASGGDPSDPAGVAPSRWRSLLGFAVSAVALAGCIVWALGQPAPEIPTSGRALGLLGASLAVYALSMALRGFRWGRILDLAGIRVAPSEPYALTLVAYMGNTVLPLRGGEALRAVLLNERSRCGWKGAIGAIIPERLLDLAAVILLLGGIVLSGTIVSSGFGLIAGIGIALLVAATLGAVLYRRQRRAGRLGGFADRIRPFAAASRPLMTVAGARLFLLTVAIWALDGTVFWLVGTALELPIGLAEGIGLAVIATAFSTIPAGPAYAGTWDASLLVALRAIGVTGGAALGYVLMVRFVVFVPVTVAGLLVAITRYGGFGRLRRRAAGAGAITREALPSAATRD